MTGTLVRFEFLLAVEGREVGAKMVDATFFVCCCRQFPIGSGIILWFRFDCRRDAAYSSVQQ